MTRPVDVIGADAVAALRDAGWIVVREDAIRLAQAFAREEGRGAEHGRRTNGA